MTGPTVTAGVLRALRIGVIAAALGSSAATCDQQPIVRLGRLPSAAGTGIPAAGTGTPAAGSGGAPPAHDESHECEEVDPVCGTDNNNYLNTCAAIRAGVGVARRGSC